MIEEIIKIYKRFKTGSEYIELYRPIIAGDDLEQYTKELHEYEMSRLEKESKNDK